MLDTPALRSNTFFVAPLRMIRFLVLGYLKRIKNIGFITQVAAVITTYSCMLSFIRDCDVKAPQKTVKTF